jgi:hypothetical protein
MHENLTDQEREWLGEACELAAGEWGYPANFMHMQALANQLSEARGLLLQYLRPADGIDQVKAMLDGEAHLRAAGLLPEEKPK